MLCEVQEHDPIIDSGFYVCIKCGLCLDQVFVYPDLQKQTSNPPFQDEKKEKNKLEAIEFLKEICSKLHIEGIELTNEIISDYLIVSDETKNLRPLPQMIDLATVSIYKTLQQRSSISPSIVDIASVTNGDLKRIWKLQKNIEECCKNKDDVNQEVQAVYEKDQVHCQQPLSPQDIILSKMGFLDLTYADFKIMDTVIKNYVNAEADFSARTIAATVMFQYLKHITKKTSMKKIAHLFLTTAMSLYRYQNYLKKNDIVLFK